MKRIFLSSFVFALLTSGLMAQKLEDQVLFTVDGNEITAEEYMAVYNKNRNLGEDIDPKTPAEYLDLYINFKLKVNEAKTLGLDTLPGFVREFSTYRDQLAKPYLSDKDVTQELIDEAYSRLQKDVRASHIMIMCSEGSAPKDTLAAFNTIKNVKAQVEKGGDFASLALEYSKDTYSAENGGDLGYFTVFNMVYPFENAVYNANVGDVVGPVRTRFGYHLIKKTDERASRGEVEVSHILILDSDKMKPKDGVVPEEKIKEIYTKLQAGENFETLAKQHSQDPTSAPKGGALPAFGINKMYPEFEDAAFGLENSGDYSAPVRSPIGWHIIKLLAKAETISKEEASIVIKQKLDRDQRSHQSSLSIIKELKKEYSYKEDYKMVDYALAKIDDKILEGKFSAPKTKYDNKEVLSFAGTKYTVADLLLYIQKNQKSVRSTKAYNYGGQLFKKFSEGQLLDYEKTRLADKYPEYRLINREYFEGILLFNLTETMVWRKSVTDSAGLEEYFNSNSANYTWKERYVVKVVDAASPKLAKKSAKLMKKGMPIGLIAKTLNVDSQLNVSVDSAQYEAGKYSLLDETTKELGVAKAFEKDGRFFAINFIEIKEPVAKTFEEARGSVISDYQKYLEENWIKELKAKYPVKVNEAVMAKVVSELEAE